MKLLSQPIPVGKIMLPWIGSKNRLHRWILPHFPSRFRDYYEPFFGGGSLFFKSRHIRENKSYISDVNRELMHFWQTLRDYPDWLYQDLCEHRFLTSEEYFYEQRDLHNERDLISDPQCVLPSEQVARASRFCYLVRTCYNGTYSLNQEGKCVSTAGSYAQPEKRARYEEMTAWRGYMPVPPLRDFKNQSRMLTEASISCSSYEEISPLRGDCVYCDPPYHDTTHDYQRDAFGEDEQKRLRDKVFEWAEDGVYVLVSNSDTPLMRELYDGWQFNTRQIKYAVSGKEPKIKTELLMKSYWHERR